MSTTFLFRAKQVVIIDGEAYNTARFNDWKKENPDAYVRIEKMKPGVSDNLRGYYYGAVIPTVKAVIPEWRDMKPDLVHEALKKVFDGVRFWNPVTKRTEIVGKTVMSSESNSKKAMDFIEKIRQWLSENYYVDLPDPHEYNKYLDSAQLK